jgi:hypothetical protein
MPYSQIAAVQPLSRVMRRNRLALAAKFAAVSPGWGTAMCGVPVSARRTKPTGRPGGALNSSRSGSWSPVPEAMESPTTATEPG